MISQIAAIVLAALVGAVCLVMARDTLLAKRILPFHEGLLDRPWEDLGPGPKGLILGMTGFIGVLFLGIFFLLVAYIAAILLHEEAARILAITMACLLDLGLAGINYRIARKTGAQTPWKASLGSLLALMASAALGSLDF